MGQAKIKKRSTAEFMRNFPLCSLCGGDNPTTTREHMPPRAMFDNKLRPDKLVMPACKECNHETSKADLVASIISRWGHDKTPYPSADHEKLIAQAKIQAPELVREWLWFASPIMQLEARKRLEHTGIQRLLIGPQTFRQLNIFAHKVTLALYFEHFKKPLSNKGRIRAVWRMKEDFNQKGVEPRSVGLTGKHGALIQGSWDTTKTFEYRYDPNATEDLFVFFARFRQNLFVAGFAAKNENTLENALTDNPDLEGIWIMPRDLLGKNPHFDTKHR